MLTILGGVMQHADSEWLEIERYILESIRSMEFGRVEITVHHSKVVQVEKAEKRRFNTK